MQHLPPERFWKVSKELDCLCLWATMLWFGARWRVCPSHRYALTLHPPLDKTSYSAMSNPEVNVIRLTCKLNREQGRLTLFLSSAGTSRPTLLWQLCIRMWGGRAGGARDRTGRTCYVLLKTICTVRFPLNLTSYFSIHWHTQGKKKNFYCYFIWTLQSIYWLLFRYKRPLNDEKHPTKHERFQSSVLIKESRTTQRYKPTCVFFKKL